MQPRPRLIQVVRRPEVVRAPGDKWPAIRRVLVVRDDGLSDLVLSLPALSALRHTYPAAWIGLVVRPANAVLAGMTGDADEVVEARAETGILEAAVRRFGPDLLVSMSAGRWAGWAARRAAVGHTVGPAGWGTAGLFERRVEPTRAAVLHDVESNLDFAHRAGAPGGPARFSLTLPAAAIAGVDEWLATRRVAAPFLVIHPGSGGTLPAWPLGHFFRLATLLVGEGAPVVFSIGPADRVVSDALDRADTLLRRIPRFSGDLAALSALLRRAAVTTGSSSGPLHLAAALGTPTLAFHAPWSFGPERRGPYAENGWAIVAEIEGASLRSSRRRGRMLLEGISPAAALGCVLSLVEGGTPRLPDRV